MYRKGQEGLEILLVHPGGPFFKNKDVGWWSIPKGELHDSEDPLEAAKREFEEETGITPAGEFTPVGKVARPRDGKTVEAWAFRGDCDPSTVKSNTIELEWPPHSGKMMTAPEVDRAGFFTPAEARRMLQPYLVPLIDLFEHRVQ